MNVFIVLGIVVFVAAFAGVYFMNVSSPQAYAFIPPYHFVVGEAASLVNSFLFVLVVSAAFFGLAVPIALGIEGLKYGSMLSTQTMPAFDLLFAIPQLFAAYSASLLAQGVVDDYQGKGTVFMQWKDALKWFIAGVVALVILVLARPYVQV
ncbi:MAG: hypothetical protein V1717_00855 [Candidatus Micrarchaeota archaeon]